MSTFSKCLIRNRLVAKTPEEEVRQRLIRRMVDEWGYPKGLISVEKGLKDSGRRFDILCFARGKEGLRPLLLIECKAGRLDREAEAQALGYNEAIGAPFVCLVNGEEVKTLWREKGGIVSVPFLPPFAQLVEKLCHF